MADASGSPKVSSSVGMAFDFLERQIEADEVDVGRDKRLVERKAQPPVLGILLIQLAALVAQDQPVLCGARPSAQVACCA